MQLLTKGTSSPKTAKSDAAGLGYKSIIMYLAPHKASGKNVCRDASPECIKLCLNTSGHGRYKFTQDARIRRTNLFFSDRQAFKAQLFKELHTFTKSTLKQGLKPAVRLNGTSDLDWEKIFPDIFTTFPTTQFYDYTKSRNRMLDFLAGKLPPNYYLTFSRSENNEAKCEQVLKAGGNVAVVFNDKNLPEYWQGWKVGNGDEHDLRFLDEYPIVGLYAKGRAKTAKESPFVVSV